MPVNPALRNYGLSAAILMLLAATGNFAPLPQAPGAPAPAPGGRAPPRVTSATCADPTVSDVDAFFRAPEPKTWWYRRSEVQFMPPEFKDNIRAIYNIMMKPVGASRNDSRGWPRNEFLEGAIRDHIGVFLDGPPSGAGEKDAAFHYNDKLKAVDERTVGLNRRKFANAVFLISANYGYLDFIANFICAARNVGNYRPLLVAQDQALHQHILDKKLPIASFLGSHINVSSFSRATNFYEGNNFARVSMMKVISARAILESGRDVLFSDVDIVFLREPFQLFRGDVDFEFQSNHWMPEFMSSSEPNTGFYFMRSNPRTIRLLWETEKYCELLKNVDDQTCLGAVLRLWTQMLRSVYVPLTVEEGNVDQYLATMGYCRERVLTFRQLHPTQFPPGFLYFFNLRTEFHAFMKTVPEHLQPAAVHANYVAGHDSKKSAIKDNGLWVYAEEKARLGPKDEHAQLICMSPDDE
ncbi:nucleotide-diphospho-sugar transferase-domain-containing protein [Hyaloraphidium curvatum]|nr:nucleotide-diphospho-sugar transferase-domain-containing protein [Hyaloraphidium curvatum]